jgi:sugar/nucleoside kinase (ribokinase family)
MTILPRILAAGHVCLDLIPQLPAQLSLEPNTLTRIGPAVVSSGGSVSNVGIALHRLGLPVRMVGKIGDDALGRVLVDCFNSIDPNLGKSLVVAPGDATSYSIVVAPGERDRLFWHCPGANDTFVANDVRDDAFDDAAWLHFGYPPVMRAIMLDGGEACADIFRRARARGLKTSLDFCSIDPKSEAGRVDWGAWLARVLPHTTLAAPSFDEMSGIFGVSGSDDESIRRVGSELLSLGAESVALKLGSCGLYFKSCDGEQFQRCFRVNVAGTTGAGDCTIAGLITGLAMGWPVDRATKLAVATGACCCEQHDATSGVRSLEETIARIEKGWEELM